LATIGGLPVRLVDTAGLRETEDPIEKVGVERAWQKVRSADLVVFLVSAEAEPDEETENIYKEIESLPHLFVINKIDLMPNYVSEWEAFAKSRGISPIKISAGKEIGLEELSKAIANKVLATWAPRFARGDSLPPCHPEAHKCRGTPFFARGDKDGAWGDNFVAPNLRQKMALVKAKEGLELALSELEKKEPLPELIAIGLRSALSSLSEITGEVTTEDLLNIIFSRFCIGK
jgi:tRNA modification GTPase